MINKAQITIPVLYNDAKGYSVFTEQSYSMEDYNGLFITQRLDALNFRHRMSEAGYSSDWHVAGDPTLIIIRSGILRIGLRDKSHRDFAAGDLFIAQDKLPGDAIFNDHIHGHRADVIGNDSLFAVHIKLAKLTPD